LTITSRRNLQDSKFNILCYEELDLGAWKRIIDESDIIFHLAGNTSLYEAEKDPLLSLRESLHPLHNLGNALLENPKDIKFIFASTATIYGVSYDRKVNENDKPRPCSYYDFYKVMCEEYLYLLNRMLGLDFISLRLANVYGPSLIEAGSDDRGIINKVAKKLLKGGTINIYGDGEYYRDYIYIEDVAKSFLLSGVEINRDNRIFNICSGSSITLKEAFNKLHHVIRPNSKIDIEYVEWPEQAHEIERRNFYGDNELFKSVFGWEPEHSFKEGIELLKKAMENAS
jgi:nucleoside-diphosphate-sugar epimerase